MQNESISAIWQCFHQHEVSCMSPCIFGIGEKITFKFVQHFAYWIVKENYLLFPDVEIHIISIECMKMLIHRHLLCSFHLWYLVFTCMYIYQRCYIFYYISQVTVHFIKRTRALHTSIKSCLVIICVMADVFCTLISPLHIINCTGH